MRCIDPAHFVYLMARIKHQQSFVSVLAVEGESDIVSPAVLFFSRSRFSLSPSLTSILKFLLAT